MTRTAKRRTVMTPRKAWAVWWDGWGTWKPNLSAVCFTKNAAREHIKQTGVAKPYSIHRVLVSPIPPERKRKPA